MSANSHNKGGQIVLIVSVCFSLLWVLYFMFVQVPVDLGEELPADSFKVLATNQPVDISQVKDYWLSSELMVKKGSELYAQYCSLCHGVRGKGDGVAGRGLNPPPRDFTQGKWKYGGKSQDLFTVITKGSQGTSMASFSHVPKLERWALVHFVRSMTKNKVADDTSKLKAFAESAD